MSEKFFKSDIFHYMQQRERAKTGYRLKEIDFSKIEREMQERVDSTAYRWQREYLGTWKPIDYQDVYKYPYEEHMPRKDPDMTIKKPILWVSEDGKFVVVEGPFPDGFQRSLTARSITEAILRNPTDSSYGIFSRPATTEAKKYAKTLRRFIEDTHNEWGEVAP